jgi:hypothetical protein
MTPIELGGMEAGKIRFFYLLKSEWSASGKNIKRLAPVQSNQQQVVIDRLGKVLRAWNRQTYGDRGI